MSMKVRAFAEGTNSTVNTGELDVANELSDIRGLADERRLNQLSGYASK